MIQMPFVIAVFRKVLRKEKEACGQRLLKEEIEKHGAAANIGKTNRPLTIRNSTHTHTVTQEISTTMTAMVKLPH